MADWLPLWESTFLRFAAIVLASVPIARYVVVPLFRGGRAFWRGVKALTAEVEQVRHLVAEQNKVVKQELQDDGNGSLKSQVVKLRTEVANLSGSMVAYVFNHSQKHKGEWEFLREEYGLDRRDPEGGEDP